MAPTSAARGTIKVWRSRWTAPATPTLPEAPLSTNFPLQNQFQNTYQGSTDVFVSKLNPFGNMLIYSTYVGGSGNDQGNGIAVDLAGNAYVGDFSQSFTLFDRGVTDVFVSDSHADLFIRNILVILAEARVKSAITDPLGICACTVAP